MPRATIFKLPQLLDRKIYKTGQTRGADDDVIFQNRVSRASTVLIPYRQWAQWRNAAEPAYENGFIVLLTPADYFGNGNIALELAAQDLAIGVNALVFYETRTNWITHNPDALEWTPARQRTKPLGGQYVARIPATTAAENGAKINRGFTATSLKGAGIRVYEYASTLTMNYCRWQLEALFWKCRDADVIAVANGMTSTNAVARKTDNLSKCGQHGLLDMARLTQSRMFNAAGFTICPLCLEELSGQGFFSRMAQPEGRDVPRASALEMHNLRCWF